MKRLIRGLFKVVAWAVVLVVLGAIGGVIGGLWYARTDGGRARIVAIARKRLRPFFPGGIKLGGIGGNYTSNLILYDVELDDREGIPAVAVKRLEVKYALWPLLGMNVSVQSLDISGGLLVSRPLANGKDNLGTMVNAEAPPLVTTLPVAIDVDKLTVEMRFARLPPHTRLGNGPQEMDVSGTLSADSISVSHAIALQVAALQVDVIRPTPVRVEAHGTVDCIGPVFHHLEAKVTGDLGYVHRFAPKLNLRGDVRVRASVDGDLSALDTHADVELVHDHISLLADARIGKHDAKVAKLAVRAPFAQLDAKGTVRFDGHFDAETKAKISDLSQLAKLGAPAITGRVTAEAKVAWDGKLRTNAHVVAEELGYATTTLRSLGLEIQSEDFLGHVRASMRGLHQGTNTLYSADVLGDSTKDGLSLLVDGQGPEDTSAHIRLHGKPRLVGNRFLGADATLDELRLGIASTEWKSTHGSTIHVDIPAETYELGRLDLVADDQQISLGGKLHGSTIDNAFAEMKHFDFSKLAAVISPGHVLPYSDLYFVASAKGPFEDPLVQVRLSGETHGKSENDLIHVAGHSEITIEHRRAAGKVFVTIGGQKASASFEAPFPLRPDAPIAATVDASVLLSPLFAELITPKLIQFQPLVMFTLSGTVTAHATVTGTTSNPEIHAAARFQNWEARGAHGGFGFSAEYKDKELATSARMELSSLPAGGGTGGGVVEATGRIPLDLASLLSGRKADLVPPSAPIHAQLNLKHVGVDYLPLRAFNKQSRFQHGTIDGTVLVAGSLAHPQLSTSFRAKDFDAVGSGINDIDAEVDASLEGAAGTIDAKLSISRSEALVLKGSIDAGRGEDPLFANWDKAKIALEGRSSGFDLSRLPLFEGVNGSLRGQVRATGTLAHPNISADFEAPLLHIGDVGFRAFEVHGHVEQEHVLATFRAEEQNGSSLVAELSLPLDGGDIAGKLDARKFRIDLHGNRLPQLRLVRCELDGSLRLHGTVKVPLLDGELTVHGGELGVTATAMRYRDIDAKVIAKNDTIDVEHFSAHAGPNGSALLHGTLRYRGMSIIGLDAKLALAKFPYQQQGVGVLLDGQLFAEGRENEKGGLMGRVRVKNGAAELPQLAETRVLLPIGPIPDVHVVDDVTAPKSGKHGMTLGAVLDGPFLIKGRDVNAHALGALSVDLTGNTPQLHGTLRLDKDAWLDLFGRRYDVERGLVLFDGTSSPQLDFRISRHVGTTLIGVDATGTTSDPKLAFWSSPPDYDAAGVVAIILSGDPAAGGVSPDNMQRRAVGAISSLLVTSIKQRFLPELPIDVFRIDTTGTTGTSTVGSQIEIGKYLTQKLYVGYSYQVGANPDGASRTNRNTGLIDYRLGKSWEVGASFGDAGVGGVDLYWTYRP